MSVYHHIAHIRANLHARTAKSTANFDTFKAHSTVCAEMDIAANSKPTLREMLNMLRAEIGSNTEVLTPAPVSAGITKNDSPSIA